MYIGVGGEWEWKWDGGVGDVDCTQVFKEVSMREVVKGLISHIKGFEFHPEGNGSLWKFLSRGAMKIDFYFKQ